MPTPKAGLGARRLSGPPGAPPAACARRDPLRLEDEAALNIARNPVRRARPAVRAVRQFLRDRG
jgi:hypothetical protein